MMPTIVVVDDNERLLQSVERILRDADYTVLVFTDPTDALAALTETAADLVISDIYMPGLNGFEFLEKLRTLRPGLPLVAISGGGRFTGADVLSESKNYGAMATLAKPVRRAELLSLIEQVLAGGQQQS